MPSKFGFGGKRDSKGPKLGVTFRGPHNSDSDYSILGFVLGLGLQQGQV